MQRRARSPSAPNSWTIEQGGEEADSLLITRDAYEAPGQSDPMTRPLLSGFRIWHPANESDDFNIVGSEFSQVSHETTLLPSHSSIEPTLVVSYWDGTLHP